MDLAAVGAVVLVRFPFSDLSQSNLRPALVLANASRGDQIPYEVEFSDDEGKTYAELALAPDQLLVLRHRPERAA